MIITKMAEAVIAAARKQHVLSAAQEQQLTPHLSGLHTPDELRRWLPEHAALPPDDLHRLLRLLPTADIVFSPYRPLAHLASGGMGRIWLAEAPDGSVVVVKTLLANTTAQAQAQAQAYVRDDDGTIWLDEPRPTSVTSRLIAQATPGSALVQRLERETRITRSLVHPHIVRCLDHGLTPAGHSFLVLEYMAHGDVRDLLERHRVLPEAVALSIARQIALALDHAHAQQLLHRDVKPANIFLQADGHAKLADFGFARSNRLNRTQLTLAGSILGSPLYMAPEQVTADAALDIRCDLYGLGCVLFECLSGMPPFQGTMHEIMRAHCVAPVPDVRRLQPHLSPGTAAVVTRLLQKDPAARFADPRALAQALAEALAALHLSPTDVVALPALTADLIPDKQPATTTIDIDLSGKAAATAAATAETQLLPGLDDEWLTLANAQYQVCCWAKTTLTMGKLRDPGVDVCLRNYPEEVHRQACSHMSRSHLQLSVQTPSATNAHTLVLEDLGSANGTTLNGRPLPARLPTTIAGAGDQIELAQAVRLAIHTVPRRSLSGNDPGLADAAPVDAVVLQRPDNRPHLVYALVLRRFLLGTVGCDIVLAGATSDVEVGRIAGHWAMRTTTTSAWTGITAGTIVPLGSFSLVAQVGSPDDL